MQNLSQNEFNQIAEKRGQSRDELSELQKEEELKIEKITNEELIISILKSNQSIAKLFNNNNNLYDKKISDIRRPLAD